MKNAGQHTIEPNEKIGIVEQYNVAFLINILKIKTKVITMRPYPIRDMVSFIIP